MKWAHFLAFAVLSVATCASAQLNTPRPTTFPTTARAAVRLTSLYEAYTGAKTLANQGMPNEATQSLDRVTTGLAREIAEFRRIYASELTSQANADAVLGKMPQQSPADRELVRLMVDQAVIGLARADVQLAARELDSAGWVNAYRRHLEADPDASGKVLEHAIQSFGAEQFTQSRLFDLLRGDLPASARETLILTLESLNRPTKAAPIESVRELYEELIAYSVDLDVAISNAILHAYVRILDQRGAADRADRLLEQYMLLVPSSGLARHALELRLAGLNQDARDMLIQHLWRDHSNTEIGRALSYFRADYLFRERRFIEAIAALDINHSLRNARTHDELIDHMAQFCIQLGRPNRELNSIARPLTALHATRITQGREQIVSPKPVPLDRLAIGVVTELTNAQPDPAASQEVTDSLLATDANLGTTGIALLSSFFKSALKDVSLDTLRMRINPSSVMPMGNAADGATAANANHLLLKARYLQNAGRIRDASDVYRIILSQFPRDPRAGAIARYALIEASLEQETTDYDSIRQQIRELVSSGGKQPPVDGRELELRLLVKRVAETEEAGRAEAWKRGLAELPALPPELSDIALAAVARLRALGLGSMSFSESLAHLIALVPDRASLQLFQEWRARDLAIRGNVTGARTALKIALAMSLTTEGGPQALLARVRNIPELSNLTNDTIKSLLSGSPSSSENSPVVDTELAQAALVALEARGNALSLRQRAYLNLFTGKTDEGLRSAAATLLSSEASAEPFDDCLNDITFALAVTDGTPANVLRFPRWLAGLSRPSPSNDLSPKPQDAAFQQLEQGLSTPPVGGNRGDGGQAMFQSVASLTPDARASLAKSALYRIGKKLIRSTAVDLAQGRFDDTVSAWIWAINTQSEADLSLPLVDQVIALACDNQAPREVDERMSRLDQAASALTRSTDQSHLRRSITVARRHARLRIADELHQQGDFEACLKALDERDQIAPLPQGAEDVEGAFLKAMSLIRLDRASQALPVLTQIRSLRASEEDHARAMFLIGFVHYQADDRASARKVFADLVAQFPKSSFAPRAQELVRSLE